MLDAKRTGSTSSEEHDQAVDSQMRVDDLVDVGDRSRTTPDAVGIEDHQRARLADAQAGAE